MADRFTPEQRHKCMSHIKGKNTKPEIRIRKALFQRGFRYRVNVKGLSGHPDIVLKKYNTAIFVNGCFWHGHEGCKKATVPQTNTVFWADKIRRNKNRDIANYEALKKDGWNVLVVWGCELSATKFDNTIKALIGELTRNS